VAEHDVFAGPAFDVVVAIGAADHIVTAGDVVIPAAAEQAVIHWLAIDDVVAGIAVDLVVVGAVGIGGVDRDDALVVWQRPVEQGMVAEQAIVAGACMDLVCAGATGDDVIAATGIDEVVAAIERADREAALQ